MTSPEPAQAGGAPAPDVAPLTPQDVTWLIRLRWIAASIAAGAIGVAGATSALKPGSVACLGGITVVWAVLNLAYSRWPAPAESVNRRGIGELVVDLSVLALLVGLSGGVANPAFLALVFPVLLATALLPDRVALGMATLASVLVLGLAALGVAGALPTGILAPLGAGESAARALGGIALFWGVNRLALAIVHLSRERERACRRAAGELLLANSELSMVADSVGDALFLWRDQENVLWSNRRACADFGCGAAGQMPGCGGICPHRPVVLRAMASGDVAEHETEVAKEGNSRTLRARAIPLKGNEGVPDRVLLVVHDLTSERAMEKQLLQATQMGVLARVTGAMAHEIGNPLASMNARVARLAMDQSPEFVRDSAGVLAEHIERIQRLVRSVQRFGRLSPGDGQDCDGALVVGDVLRMVRLDPRARNAVFEADVPEDMPPVSLGRDQLTQVFLNLAINAVEAMPSGGTARISAKSDGRWILFRFEDSGTGIPREMRDKLFCPFESTKEHGTGLGLFLSRRIVTEAGGEIRVVHGEPKGTTFEIALPGAEVGWVAQS